MATQTETAAAPTQQGNGNTPETKRKGPNPVAVVIILILVVVGGYFGIKTILFNAHHESTDDAQVDGHIYPILPRVSGQVLQVFVSDNEHVKTGAPLLKIDPSDYITKRDQAEAALLSAQASLTTSEANANTTESNIAVAQANVAQVKANVDKLARDLQRDKNLRKDDIIPQSELDNVQAQYDAAISQMASAQGSLTSARNAYTASVKQIEVSRATIAQRKADLDNANLQVSYCSIFSPESGSVSRKNVEPGQYITAGQSLMAIVNDDSNWVTGNFKELQLAKMRVGQEVEIEVDAYPGKTFKGRIQSIAAATGAKFALLPPDNASGNFVKVVQRVPVKIVVTDKVDPNTPLRTGMNVNVVVNLDNK